MKKLVLSTVCVLAVTGAAFAQGLVDWATASGAAFIVQTNATQNSPFFSGAAPVGGTIGNAGPGLAGPGFYDALLYGSQNTTGVAAAAPTTLSALLNNWGATGLYATNFSATGFNGRLAYVNPSGTAVVPWGGNSDAGGKSNNIIMVGWSANLGSTWLAVSNVLNNWSTLGSTIVGPAFLGISATGYIVGNSAPGLGAALFNNGQTPNGLPFYQPSANPQTLFLIPNVPEPATMALVGLGGLSLMLFRRQRK